MPIVDLRVRDDGFADCRPRSRCDRPDARLCFSQETNTRSLWYNSPLEATMATKRTASKTGTQEKGWIHTLCHKHTPQETAIWIEDSWMTTVQSAFAAFRSAIANRSSDIPNEMFSVNNIRHGNRNPLFSFLRPKKILYIALALKSIPQTEAVKVQQIFSDYIKEWESALTELRERFPNNQAAANSDHLLCRLLEQVHFFSGLNADNITPDRHDYYKQIYHEFCDSFNSIPCGIANTEQMANAIRAAVQFELDQQDPKVICQRHEGDATRRQNIALVVKRLIALKHYHAKNKTGMSVEKALDYLEKNDDTYADLLRQLDLSVASWKKYVAEARKVARTMKSCL